MVIKNEVESVRQAGRATARREFSRDRMAA